MPDREYGGGKRHEVLEDQRTWPFSFIPFSLGSLSDVENAPR